MQAVDRHDQLRELFSLSKRHGFKKYYKKIALGLIDMALVNAWLHYHLVHDFTGLNKENARFKFMEAIAQDFLNRKDWSNDSLIGSTRGILQELSNTTILHDQVVNSFACV